MKPIILAVGVEGVQRCVSVFGKVYWHAFVHEKGDLCRHFGIFYYSEWEIIEYLTQVAFLMSSPRVEGRWVVYKEKRAAGGDLGRQVSQLT